MTPYGMELILDLKGCQLDSLDRPRLERFFVELCQLIDMKRHGDPIFWEDHSGTPHLHGISAVQFIETSTIVVHPLPLLGSVYLNVFSCKQFDPSAARDFCIRYWGANDSLGTTVLRN